MTSDCQHIQAIAGKTMYIGKKLYCPECENTIECLAPGEYQVIE